MLDLHAFGLQVTEEHLAGPCRITRFVGERVQHAAHVELTERLNSATISLIVPCAHIDAPMFFARTKKRAIGPRTNSVALFGPRDGSFRGWDVPGLSRGAPIGLTPLLVGSMRTDADYGAKLATATLAERDLTPTFRTAVDSLRRQDRALIRSLRSFPQGDAGKIIRMFFGEF